jgi:phosphoribosylanthranilate isomerase
MIVQIYTMQTPEEAQTVIRQGVDHIGLTPAARGLPGEINYATARAIVEAVGDSAKKIALSVERELDPIVEMVLAVQPDVLHLCGDIRVVTPAAVSELRRRLPGVQIMQAIAVTGGGAVADALAFEEVADYLILDTRSEELDAIGAAGVTHDWNISREIVERVRIPVILAGGLTPENVAEAIHAVHPWGVDSLTHTNHRNPDGSFHKDIERIRQFVENARAVSGESHKV